MARYKTYTLQSALKRVFKRGDGCWEWPNKVHPITGYSRIGFENKTNTAHKVIYELANGKVEEGMHLDHLCRNRWCVNPSHLEVVTPRENLLRGATLAAENAAKTHCKNGHEFTYENTYRRKDRPTRECRACRRISVRKSQGVTV